MAVKNIFHCLLSICLMSTFHTAIAGNMGSSVPPSSSYHPKVIIQAGGFWPSFGRAQDINIVDLVGDHFSVSDHSRFKGLAGLGIYFNALERERFNVSVGVNTVYFSRTSVSGIVTQEQLFTNLAYRYSVSNWPVYLAAKTDITSFSDNYALTLDAGVGPNFNKTSRFNETSLDGGITLPDYAFSGRTSTVLSAMAGVGIKWNNVFGHLPLECGYRYFYLGQGRFNRLTDQLLNTLNTGHGHANAIVCAVTL
ncbi:hypothetical protein [Legionella quinlivanii]|nr:hypothetical protein [Legionella quinlivanii]